MINFKNRSEAGPSAVIVISIVILVATLAFMLLVPVPTAAGLAAGRVRSRQQLETEIDQAKARTQQAQTSAAGRLWEGDPENIMAQVLARLTTQAARGHLQLSSFRPQKLQPVRGMIELPLSLQIAGPYPTVLSFLQSLDAPANKLVLRSVQIASGNGSSSAVTASIGLSVYYIPPMVTTNTTNTTTTTTSAPGTKPASGAAATSTGGNRG